MSKINQGIETENNAYGGNKKRQKKQTITELSITFHGFQINSGRSQEIEVKTCLHSKNLSNFQEILINRHQVPIYYFSFDCPKTTQMPIFLTFFSLSKNFFFKSQLPTTVKVLNNVFNAKSVHTKHVSAFYQNNFRRPIPICIKRKVFLYF